AGIYARVSTSDGRQDARNQTDELVAWAARLGHEVSKVYTDKITGTKGADERPALQEALRDAHERRYDCLLVWALDRLSRGGIGAMAGILDRLRQSGVALKSYKEPWLDTSSPALAELLTAIFAWIARQERDRIRDRVRAGLERARARGTRSGKAIGRPRLAFDMERARLEVAKAGSIRAAALTLGCHEKTLRNRLAS